MSGPSSKEEMGGPAGPMSGYSGKVRIRNPIEDIRLTDEGAPLLDSGN
jgi:hypothetical protein